MNYLDRIKNSGNIFGNKQKRQIPEWSALLTDDGERGFFGDGKAFGCQKTWNSQGPQSGEQGEIVQIQDSVIHEVDPVFVRFCRQNPDFLSSSLHLLLHLPDLQLPTDNLRRQSLSVP